MRRGFQEVLQPLGSAELFVVCFAGEDTVETIPARVSGLGEGRLANLRILDILIANVNAVDVVLVAGAEAGPKELAVLRILLPLVRSLEAGPVFERCREFPVRDSYLDIASMREIGNNVHQIRDLHIRVSRCL